MPEENIRDKQRAYLQVDEQVTHCQRALEHLLWLSVGSGAAPGGGIVFDEIATATVTPRDRVGVVKAHTGHTPRV